MSQSGILTKKLPSRNSFSRCRTQGLAQPLRAFCSRQRTVQECFHMPLSFEQAFFICFEARFYMAFAGLSVWASSCSRSLGTPPPASNTWRTAKLLNRTKSANLQLLNPCGCFEQCRVEGGAAVSTEVQVPGHQCVRSLGPGVGSQRNPSK